MGRRLTAKEVADALSFLATMEISGETQDVLVNAANNVRKHLVPQWQDAPGADGWYWCERLDADAPPQLIRETPDGLWSQWTVAGWVPFAGRVAPCTGRP